MRLVRSTILLLAALPLAGHAALAAPAAAPAEPSRQQSVVVLPFDSFAGAEEAPDAVAALVVEALAARGWKVIPPAAVEELLEKERIRYLDSLDDRQRNAVAQATGADAIVSGTIFRYGGTRNPIVALASRMVRADGTLAWGDIAGVSADDTERALGFGRKNGAGEVGREAVDRLLQAFPSTAESGGPVKGRRKPRFVAGPVAFRAHDFDPSKPHRICILPFENQSDDPDAVRIVADVLALRLAAGEGFEVIEPAVVRAAALRAGIASFRYADNETLAKLVPLLGTSLFLTGSIMEFDDPSAGRSTGTPDVDLDLSLADVTAGEVLWTTQHERKGTDYVGLLMLGEVTNAVSLTDRVVAEMVDVATRPTDQDAAARAAGRAALKRTPEKHSRLRGPQKKGEEDR